VEHSIGVSLPLDALTPHAGEPARRPVIDAHCHAGKGLHYGKPDSDPWTTFNDPDWTLRRGSFASGKWREHVKAIEACRRLPNLYLETFQPDAQEFTARPSIRCL